MKIVNPVGARPDNDVALAATKSAVNFVRYFDPRRHVDHRRAG